MWVLPAARTLETPPRMFSPDLDAKVTSKPRLTKEGCLYQGWSFLSCIVRVDCCDKQRSAAAFNRVLCSKELGDVPDTLTSVKPLAQEVSRRGVVGVVSNPLWCVAGSLVKRTTQRTKHVLHMFVESTVINIRHGACRSSGPAFSRRRPLPPR